MAILNTQLLPCPCTKFMVGAQKLLVINEEWGYISVKCSRCQRKGERAKTEAAAYQKWNDGFLPKACLKRRKNRSGEGGFAFGVILYMLAMVGVGAGVLFSGYM